MESFKLYSLRLLQSSSSFDFSMTSRFSQASTFKITRNMHSDNIAIEDINKNILKTNYCNFEI